MHRHFSLIVLMGWINSDLFMKWFEFFLANIPPTRPVLLIMDGHGTHMSIELIELARSNDVHLLCLPSHTTHILQPLDVGVFKSFKGSWSKACSKYLAANPGRVITSDKLASLICRCLASLSNTPEHHVRLQENWYLPHKSQ